MVEPHRFAPGLHPNRCHPGMAEPCPGPIDAVAAGTGSAGAAERLPSLRIWVPVFAFRETGMTWEETPGL